MILNDSQGRKFGVCGTPPKFQILPESRSQKIVELQQVIV